MSAPASDLAQPHLSVHTSILALFTYENENGHLNAVRGKEAGTFEARWTEVSSLLKSRESITLNDFDFFESAIILPGMNTNDSIKVFEYQAKNESQTRGIFYSSDGAESDFDLWFIGHVLRHSNLRFADSPVVEDSLAEDYINKITKIFEDELRHITADDQWEALGRQRFQSVVRFFVHRNLKIEACLPAFPCKSHNTLKVAGVRPDKGEELALRRLLDARRQISKIYPPGMKVWIVSDGHVFSDCIGADDTDVDEYGGNLRKLAASIASRDTLDFKALPDVFASKHHKFQTSYVENVETPHYLNTKIDPESDVCRKIMMAGCHTEDNVLRALIDTQDPIKLALYRGFRRFMEEDLAMNSVIKTASRSARKRLCGKVAFEMIKRNEAYSNLVELMFPFHIRLSIHAHSNSGPKFGIRLLSRKDCKIIRSLNQNDSSPVFDDLLHIPTPWHNCVIKVAGDNMHYIGKSEVVLKAIENGTYGGEWVEGDLSKGQGGYFSIWNPHDSTIEKIAIQVDQTLTVSAT